MSSTWWRSEFIKWDYIFPDIPPLYTKKLLILLKAPLCSFFMVAVFANLSPVVMPTSRYWYIVPSFNIFLGVGGMEGKRALIISINHFSIKLWNCLWNHVACHERVVITAVAKAIISEELDPSPIVEPTSWKSSQISKLLITTILFEMKISWNFLKSESSSLDPNGCVLTQTAMAGTRLCCFAQFLCYA